MNIQQNRAPTLLEFAEAFIHPRTPYTYGTTIPLLTGTITLSNTQCPCDESYPGILELSIQLLIDPSCIQHHVDGCVQQLTEYLALAWLRYYV